MEMALASLVGGLTGEIGVVEGVAEGVAGVEGVVGVTGVSSPEGPSKGDDEGPSEGGKVGEVTGAWGEIAQVVMYHTPLSWRQELACMVIVP